MEAWGKESMINQMDELDFEQTELGGDIQEFEVTRRAAKKFREIVNLETFEEEDANVIFNYL